MLLILSFVGIILLALYAYASTGHTPTMGDAHGYQEAQRWADDLEASLYPYHAAVDHGLAPNPWTPPARLAGAILDACSPPVEVPASGPRLRAKGRVKRKRGTQAA